MDAFLLLCNSITVTFFAKENEDCNLTATKDGLPNSDAISFELGLGQKFRQPCGTGIDFSKIEETELTNCRDIEIYPLVVKAEAYPLTHNESEGDPVRNSQITKAVFEKKENGEYQVRVMKQILWVNDMRYELQEIYGIGNVVEGDTEENDSGKECVICLSEPRDTTVLPCRHMVCTDTTSSLSPSLPSLPSDEESRICPTDYFADMKQTRLVFYVYWAENCFQFLRTVY